MDSSEWDARYAATDLVWTATPNRWVEAELSDLPPGRAVDLACGEGRNALWLAGRGWRVTAVDFSGVALAKGRRAAQAAGDGRADRIDWIEADLLGYQPEPGSYDAVVIAYLQLPADERRVVIRRAATALADGGVALVVAHDTANLAGGVGGPPDPAVLYTADDVRSDLTASGIPLRIERAQQVLRPVEGEPRPAIDLLVRATRSSRAER
ncbi:MAG TPA: class I SAM-dependent methyltransferase [Jatrophihabitantaceae bacterium]|jgi:SAM-dependent methyltransferase